MVRISDRIWNHVEKTDEVWKCRFCDHVFAKGIAAQIVKYHLAGVGGPGTKFCSDVPGHVKMEARQEINEGEKKRRIIMSTSPSSSSNVTVEVSPKNDEERMIEQETKLRSRDGGVVECESDQEMIEAEFPAVMVKNGDSVCEICRRVLGTPAKWIQWHLADIGGSGDIICTSMPDDVKSAILQEITESKRKRRKSVPGSSHTEDVPTVSIEDVAAQPLEAGWSGSNKALEDLHNEADHGVRDEKMVEVEDASVKGSREEEILQQHPRKKTNMAFAASVTGVLVSTVVLSAAVILKQSVAVITDFAASEFPLVYRFVNSWLQPPFFHFIINCIIITIAYTDLPQSVQPEQLVELLLPEVYQNQSGTSRGSPRERPYIIDGRSITLARHLKKSDTWDTAAPSSRSGPSKTTKSETYSSERDNKPKSWLSYQGSGKEDPSLSQDELNRRLDAFIKIQEV